MFDERGRYPEVLLEPIGAPCLADDPQQIGLADEPPGCSDIDPWVCVQP